MAFGIMLAMSHAGKVSRLDGFVLGFLAPLLAGVKTLGPQDIGHRLPRDLAAGQFADLSQYAGVVPARLVGKVQDRRAQASGFLG
jgi:hypothetical protein